MSHPLEGVRILELGQIIAGTYGCQVLSDLGAEVIKIEAPEGDLGRIPSVAPYRGLSGLFLTFNRNKQSVVINLKNEAGRQLFYDLVKISDVVIDNFRPGVLERLQIDYKTLSKINPRIIQCSVTGFGGAGAYKDLPALDLNIQAITGHMAVTGEPGRPPVRVGIPLADISGGIFSAKGILAALFDRERTGKGRRIEISMFDTMLHFMTYMGTMWLTNGEVPKPPGSAHDYSVPWQAFATSGRLYRVATRQEIFWRSCAACSIIPISPAIRDLPTVRSGEEPPVLVPWLERFFARARPPIGSKCCGRRRAGGAGKQFRRRFCRAAGRRARDDRRIRSSRRSAKCGCRAIRSRCRIWWERFRVRRRGWANTPTRFLRRCWL